MGKGKDMRGGWGLNFRRQSPMNERKIGGWYIALYPRGVVCNEERRYHWAFLIGLKAEKGNVDIPSVRYHVKKAPVSGWVYEEKGVNDVRSMNTLLVRIIIAKVENEQYLINLLRNLPVQALAEIAKDGKCVGTSQLDWGTIEAFARQYAAQKTAAGRYEKAEDMLKPKLTYDLLEGKEVVA
ncbi:hypothetical protein DM02DRAFT_641532 [Periconia macrospinosa]|uniref:Uncharacterized protein n=1 Tax=Periconia macrospinosa TaxID=97972 RepID=A0A2V1DUQ4_9PLEO|nr:hypothetical protein DM02DRAFT_641532 [Periconia macrospinosa]